MSIFDLTDFERQGQVEKDIHFKVRDDARQLVNKLTADASRLIQIYTPDLEPSLYSNQQFVDNLLAFARGNRHAQIQILVLDPSSAIHQGHGLLRLAHTLTSSIDIRIPAEEYREDNLAFILVDRKGFLYRPEVKEFQGIFNPDCKVRATKLSDIFTIAWEHAEPDPQTRRLSI